LAPKFEIDSDVASNVGSDVGFKIGSDVLGSDVGNEALGSSVLNMSRTDYLLDSQMWICGHYKLN
jgi:hypothetical protein